MIPYQKVKTGDTFAKIPAITWNGMIDAAIATQQDRNSIEAGLRPQSKFGILAKVKNNTGSDQDRFAVLQITGILYGPSDNANWFEQPCLIGGTPDTSLTPGYGNFVVTQEPIKAGKIGDGLIWGYTQVKIKVNHAGDGFADLLSTDTTQLNSGFGSAQIIYKDSGTGTGKTALVFLGGPGEWTLHGKFASDLASGSAASMTIWRFVSGMDTNTGVTITVSNPSSCTIKGGQFVYANWYGGANAWIAAGFQNS